MKKLLTGLLVVGILFGYTFATTTYLSKTENGHAYKVLKVSLDSKSKIIVSVVNNFLPAQSLKTLTDNVGGVHAINGGFFCPNEGAYSRCEGNTTDGLRISNGVLYSKRGEDIGDNKSVFGFDENGIPMSMAEKSSRYRAQGTWQNDDVEAIYNGMMLPTLVKNGINVAVLNDEMNSDPKQGKSSNKTFICTTEDKSIVYMGYVDNVTFSSIADYIIETFDCYNGGLLDNGGTKAMIYNGKYVAGPGRNMMDAFVVVEGDNVGTNIAPISVVSSGTPQSIDSEELQTAIAWMYNSGLTMYNTIEGFLPNNTMTREEASKFFSVFAKTIFDKSEIDSFSCNFKDLNRADPTLKNTITSSCKLGIFKGYKGYFSPFDKLTNAQAITVLIRIMTGILEEPTNAYYTNYLLTAKSLGLIENIDVNKNITRGEAAILLYKANKHIGSSTTTNGDVSVQTSTSTDKVTDPVLITKYMEGKLFDTEAIELNSEGVYKLGHDDITGALECFNQAIELDSNMSWAYTNRGNLKIDLGQLVAGCEDLAKAVAIDSRYHSFPNRPFQETCGAIE